MEVSILTVIAAISVTSLPEIWSTDGMDILPLHMFELKTCFLICG